MAKKPAPYSLSITRVEIKIAYNMHVIEKIITLTKDQASRNSTKKSVKKQNINRIVKPNTNGNKQRKTPSRPVIPIQATQQITSKTLYKVEIK